MAEGQAPTELPHRLREAGPTELLELLTEHRDVLDVACARQVLRNPHTDQRAIEVLLDLPHLLQAYEVRRDVALSPRTPEVHAVRHVAGLFWRDLARATVDVRVRPRVRRAAEQALAQRLPGLALGEKISLARTAGGLLLQQMRWETHAQVLEALLDNPRMTEGILVPVVARESTPGSVLALIARNRKWGNRYEIRSAVCRNPRTPPALAMSLLGTLKRVDVRAVSQKPSLALVVRNKAREILG